MTAVAAHYGYRDGSAVHRVVERLEAKAKSGRALDRQSTATSCPGSVTCQELAPNSHIELVKRQARGEEKRQKDGDRKMGSSVSRCRQLLFSGTALGECLLHYRGLHLETEEPM